MPRYRPLGTGLLSEEQRHPLLTSSGRSTLSRLLEDADAPTWNHRCGDRLDGGALAQVRRYAGLVESDPPRRIPSPDPPWLAGWLAHVAVTVPRYRRAHSLAAPFTTSRDDLAGAWWELVPDDADLAELIWFPTSGSGRTPVVVPTHPVAVSCYYPLLLAAARWWGVTPALRDDRADWITVFSQGEGGFTVPSWSSYLGTATAKVNLHASSWRRPDDRRTFLERHDPRVVAGDPVSLAHLADLGLALGPAVVLSTATHLSGATRERLAGAFGCPVVDVYSTTESGPVAALRPDGRMGLLQPRLHVEVTDDAGMPVAAGDVGQITLTGGFNPYLPLVRYRTGDDARLGDRSGAPVLERFAGRASVLLRDVAGTDVNSFDLAQILEELPLRRWSVRQRGDDSVVVAVEPEHRAGHGIEGRVAAAVERVLGAVPVRVEPLTAQAKVVPFTAEVVR
jgi:phenylacetate-CoA ligase